MLSPKQAEATQHTLRLLDTVQDLLPLCRILSIYSQGLSFHKQKDYTL